MNRNCNKPNQSPFQHVSSPATKARNLISSGGVVISPVLGSKSMCLVTSIAGRFGQLLARRVHGEIADQMDRDLVMKNVRDQGK